MKIISKNKDFYDYLVGVYGEDEKLVFDRRLNFFQNPLIACPKFLGFEQEYPNKKYAWHSLLWVGNELIHIFASNTNEVFTSFDVENIDGLFSKRIDIWNGAELTLKTGEKLHFFTQFGENEIFQHHNLVKEYGFLAREQSPIFNLIFREFVTLNYIRHHNISLYHSKIDVKTVPILLLYATQESYNNAVKITNGITTIYSKRHNHKCEVLLDNQITEIYRPYFYVFANPTLQNLGIFFDPVFIWQALSEYLGLLHTAKEASLRVTNDEKIVNKGFDIKQSFRPKMKNKK